jgi:hypothetical protein
MSIFFPARRQRGLEILVHAQVEAARIRSLTSELPTLGV